MGFFDRISQGLQRSRDKFKEEMNVLLDRGPDLDEEFWDGLEETLILADIGGAAACDIVENLRDQATRKALPDAYAVLDMLNDQIADTFTEGGQEILGGEPACVLFVGINGTGKTTTVGKLSKEAHDAGRKVILGSADTFRAAAIEQLEVWANRADVEMVTRERGADPARSATTPPGARREAEDADLVLIDTAGRLHTSADPMREPGEGRQRGAQASKLPVYTALVIDATTGQNGCSRRAGVQPRCRAGRAYRHEARRHGQAASRLPSATSLSCPSRSAWARALTTCATSMPMISARLVGAFDQRQA